MTLRFNTRYRPPPQVGVRFEKPSLTVQSERDETDVHNILDRYVRTGDLGYFGHGPASKPFYGDFSEAPDFATAMNMQKDAAEYFATLPSKIRLQFGNDYREMVKFLGDPRNDDQARELGLLEKLPEQLEQGLYQIKDTVQNEPSIKDPEPVQG